MSDEVDRRLEMMRRRMLGATPTIQEAIQSMSSIRRIMEDSEDQRLNAIEIATNQYSQFLNPDIGVPFLSWTTMERDKIRARFNALRKEQRQQLAAKDAIIEQLRERLDRAKRGR